MSPSPPDPHAWRRDQPSRRPRPRSLMRKVLLGLLASFAAFVALGLALSLAGYQPPESGDSGAGSGSGPPGGQAEDDTNRRGSEQGNRTREPGEAPDKDRGDVEAQQEGKRKLGSDSGHVVVKRIVDGDTLVVSGDGSVVPDRSGVEVRLLEVDTPEAGKCFADKATARTNALLPVGSTVRVERDEDLKDRYGRYLLYVWNDARKFVNLSLVADGYAKAVLYEPNDKYWQRISEEGRDAKAARAGLWAGCDRNRPPEKQRVEPVKPDEPDRPDIDAPKPDTPSPEPRRPDPPPKPPKPEPPSEPVGPPAGPDLDCSDLPGPTPVGPDDPHRLDADGDGVGCDE